MREGDNGCAGCLWPAGIDALAGQWPRRRPETTLTGSRAVLAAGDGCEPMALAQEEDVLVCVLGSPRWPDETLTRAAASGGHGQAAIAAWRTYGDRLVEHLGGAFGLVLIDQAQRTVMLATDRFGVYPLAWAQVEEGIVFGSSVGAVREHPAVAGELNPQAIFDYLYFHVVPAPISVYRGISRLGSAERLLWRDGRCSVARYWEPRFVAPGSSADQAALSEALRTHLSAAVGDAAGDATQAACFLSGGLDSSSVTGMAAGHAGQQGAPVRAYTMGFDAEGFDEMAYARLAAEHFGVELRERYISPDEVAEAMPLVAAYYDEPFGNSSAVPAFVCARTAVQEGTTRMLAGDGGDELFAGNARYVRQQLFHYYDRLPSAAQTLVQRALLLGKDSDDSPLGKVPGLSKLVSYVAQARPGMPARYDSYNFVLRYGPQNMLSEDWLSQVQTEHPMQLQQEIWDRAPTEDLLQRMLYLDWQFTLADNDLRKVGGMCAAAGVQVRYPMLDDRVLDLSLEVPPSLMIRRHRLRHFFKETVDGFLPQDIINKSKHGFGLPFGVWLKESAKLHDLVFPALEGARARGIVRPAFIDEMVRAHRDGHAHYFGGMLWIITMLELWLDSHGH